MPIPRDKINKIRTSYMIEAKNEISALLRLVQFALICDNFEDKPSQELYWINRDEKQNPLSEFFTSSTHTLLNKDRVLYSIFFRLIDGANGKKDAARKFLEEDIDVLKQCAVAVGQSQDGDSKQLKLAKRLIWQTVNMLKTIFPYPQQKTAVSSLMEWDTPQLWAMVESGLNASGSRVVKFNTERQEAVADLISQLYSYYNESKARKYGKPSDGRIHSVISLQWMLYNYAKEDGTDPEIKRTEILQTAKVLREVYTSGYMSGFFGRCALQPILDNIISTLQTGAPTKSLIHRHQQTVETKSLAGPRSTSPAQKKLG